MADSRKLPPGTNSEDTKPITVVTVYTPYEANTYLLDEYLDNPTTATVLKQFKYKRSPVVRTGEVIDLATADPDTPTRQANPPETLQQQGG